MKSKTTRKLAMAGVFTALAVVGSMLSVPIASSKCAPVQHMINILSAVLLGPGYSVGIAFVASLLRNVLGLGSFLAFPGSMVGALCCGLVYAMCKKLWLTCCWLRAPDRWRSSIRIWTWTISMSTRGNNPCQNAGSLW